MITELLYENLGNLVSTLGDIFASVFTIVILIAGAYTIGKIISRLLHKR